MPARPGPGSGRWPGPAAAAGPVNVKRKPAGSACTEDLREPRRFWFQVKFVIIESEYDSDRSEPLSQ